MYYWNFISKYQVVSFGLNVLSGFKTGDQLTKL